MTRRVLVADADGLGRTVVTTLLALDGHEVVVAGDREEALASLVGTPAFDVALLARALPDGTWLDVLARLRSNEATAELPVVLLSDVAPVDVDPLAAGAQAMVTTPCSPMHLLGVLDELLDEA